MNTNSVGIIFTPEQIYALPNMTLTHRIAKLKPVNAHPDEWRLLELSPQGIAMFEHTEKDIVAFRRGRYRREYTSKRIKIRCPYGPVGRRLYIKESIRVCGADLQGRPLADPPVLYYADGAFIGTTGEASIESRYPHVRPAIMMPERFARYFLETTSLGVKRLQNITESDAKAEGVEKMHIDDLGQTWATYVRGFQSDWDSNHPRPHEKFEANPWVWAIGFKQIE
jgi:hypothetical protein